MNNARKFLFLVFLALDLVPVIFIFWLIFGPGIHLPTIAVLSPKGIIAQKEFRLLVTAVFLMMLIVVPVFIFTIYVTWKFRAGNKQAGAYTPDWGGTRALQITWWALPGLIIFSLAIINWRSTHELDPLKPLNSTAKPITIQVVALQWKWLFIYPEQNIATVNFVEFPEATPVNFQLTADAPMNSFWIPQLGGQMYAMTGMSTQLHLMANHSGDYNGSAAEISGGGFADMRFIARASSEADFSAWLQTVKNSNSKLDVSEYNRLSEPSENNPPTFYASTESNLYNRIMMKFIAPISTSTPEKMPKMQNMDNSKMY